MRGDIFGWPRITNFLPAASQGYSRRGCFPDGFQEGTGLVETVFLARCPAEARLNPSTSIFSPSLGPRKPTTGESRSQTSFQSLPPPLASAHARSAPDQVFLLVSERIPPAFWRVPSPLHSAFAVHPMPAERSTSGAGAGAAFLHPSNIGVLPQSNAPPTQKPQEV